MSGFLPRGYFSLAQIRDILGVDELGRWLASGEMVAAVRDGDGTPLDIRPEVWMRDGAAQLISEAALPVAGDEGPFPLFIRSRNPRHLLAIMEVHQRRRVAPDPSSASSHGRSRARGQRASVSVRVANEMRKLDPAELECMKEEAMAAMFGASRDTCRKVRNKVLADLQNTSTNADK